MFFASWIFSIELDFGLGILLVLALPLARVQATFVYDLGLRCSLFEKSISTWSGARETLHKCLWVALCMFNQYMLLEPNAWQRWGAFRIEFLMVGGVVAAIALIGSIYRTSRFTKARFGAPWVWFDVQCSAFCEEVLFRALLPFAGLEIVAASNDPIEVVIVFVLSALLFGVLHFRGGRPRGARGATLMTLLGLVCLCGSYATGTLLFGYALHGLLLGSIGFWRWYLVRLEKRVQIKSVSCLQVIRMRHSIFVTDWEALRVERLCASESELASAIRRIIESRNDGVVFDASEVFQQEANWELDPIPTRGLQWWRESNALLAVQLPEKVLPGRDFSYRAFATCIWLSNRIM